MYIAINRDSGEQKRSSKGIQNRVELTYTNFKQSVYEDKTLEGENISIRLHQNEMKTMVVKKTSLKNVFIKGHVGDDRVTVTPFRKFIYEQ